MLKYGNIISRKHVIVLSPKYQLTVFNFARRYFGIQKQPTQISVTILNSMCHRNQDHSGFILLFSMYSRLLLSRNRRDPPKNFEISVLRHIRFVVLRKKQFEQPNFTNDYVI